MCCAGRPATRYRADKGAPPRVPTAFQSSKCVRGELKRRKYQVRARYQVRANPLLHLQALSTQFLVACLPGSQRDLGMRGQERLQVRRVYFGLQEAAREEDGSLQGLSARARRVGQPTQRADNCTARSNIAARPKVSSRQLSKRAPDRAALATTAETWGGARRARPRRSGCLGDIRRRVSGI